jgi:hypothetical protein
VLRDPDFIAGAATMKSGPVNLIDRVLTASVPGRSLSVDWRGALPVITR